MNYWTILSGFVDDEYEVQSIVEQAFAANEDKSDFLKQMKNSPRKIVGRMIANDDGCSVV